MKFPNCPECTRLWDAYGQAIRQCIQLDGKIKLAEIGRQNELIQQLRPSLDEAVRQRESLRLEIESHKRHTHGSEEAAKA